MAYSVDESTKDKIEIYELQLVHLEEQLESIMIQNQTLAKQVKELKSMKDHTKLLEKLNNEKIKSQELAARLRQRDCRTVTDDWVDVADELQDDVKVESATDGTKNRAQQIQEWFVEKMYALLEDLTADNNNENIVIKEEPLSVKRLKENLRQFRTDTKPIFNILRGLQALFSWKQPAITLFTLLVYLYVIWHGWFIPLAFFLIAFRLFINLLKYRYGFNINFHYLQLEDNSGEEDKKYGLSDKIDIVLQVAKKVQNTMANVSRGIQKIKNLLTWQTQRQTQKIFIGVCIALVASCILPGPLFFMIIGLKLGIKLFITDFLYKRFPRFRKKYDSVYVMWQHMRSDEEVIASKTRDSLHKNTCTTTPIHARFTRAAAQSDTSNDETLLDDRRNADSEAFQKLFNLPDSEYIITGWEKGRACTYIDSDKSLLSQFTYGRLYLSKNFICFGPSKGNSKYIIPLKEISRIKKAKPLQWMPGKGMALEITVINQEKPFIFGGLLHRDESFSSIMSVGELNGLPWAHDYRRAQVTPTVSSNRIKMSDIKED